ncbi:MAG: RluA family pseudouridine synthase [Planctomycetota bacterium]|jgi:23S rRNA pseudouridine1911/1915/1917 synthase|nr:RluA family pseudouridine synthase [Planctomycetota bacterium]MDA1201699.1 RluA family pseudouridine synthase [Planctomycetota bacterium]
MTRQPEQETIRVLFEDDHLIALVKPAGLITANAPAGKPSLFTWLKDHVGGGFVGIVSRLDAPVSGVVVAAKDPATAAGLAEQFRDRAVGKAYAAVVTGRFPAAVDTWIVWEEDLFWDPSQRKAGVAGDGRPEVARRGTRAGQGGSGRSGGSRSQPAAAQRAITRACVTRRAGEVSLVALEPLTGRRHQLRVQLASRGCPIVGDRLYGSRLPFGIPGGIALRAVRLMVTHPVSGEQLVWEAACRPVWEAAFPSLFCRSESGGQG